MDSRSTHRKRTFIGGKVLFNGGGSVLDCVVKDLSDGGARLAVEGALAVPQEFNLRLSDGRVFDCTVRWRQFGSLGVRFAPTM